MSVVAAAYGLRFDGTPSTPWLAVEGADDWPCVSVELSGEEDPALDLDAMSVRFPARIEHGELIHPMIARLAVRVGMERGLDALHAGAIVGESGAWAIAGAKEAGKSTLLAACAEAGIDVLTDDTLVMAGDRCLAGPRCIDLREPAARHLGATHAVRPQTPRRRVTLAPTAAEQPLAGVVHLAWGDELALEPIEASEAVRRLLALQHETTFPREALRILELAALPNLELRRPRDLEGLPDAVELLGAAMMPRRWAPATSS